MFRLLLQELKFRRHAILGWSLGLSFFPIVYIGIYPSVAEEMSNLADLEFYKALGMSLGTFPDWMGSIMLALFPMVVSIYAIINGTGTLAGEEEDGRLEMIVTLPLARWKVLTAKALALCISTLVMTFIVAVVTLAVFIGIQDQIETEIEAASLVTMILSTWPFVFSVAMISMFLAAFCPTRRMASMIAAVILIISYFGSNLANSTSALEPFEPLFLSTYVDASGQAVIDGQAAGDMLVLLAIGAVSFALAILFFQRRKLTVGAWPWQKARIEG